MTIMYALWQTQPLYSAALLIVDEQDWPLVAREGAQVVHATVGAIAAYDSRTYHRGLGNRTKEGRPALIFCYDKQENPPPGCGSIAMIAHANWAHALNIVSTGWNACKALVG